MTAVSRSSSDSTIDQKKRTKSKSRLDEKPDKLKSAVLRRYSLDLSPCAVFSVINMPRYGLDILLNYEGIRIDHRMVRKEDVSDKPHVFATSKYRITGLSWRNGPEDCPLEGLHLFDCYEELTEPAVKMKLFRHKKPHVRRFVIFPVSNAHHPTLILDIPQKLMHKKVKVYDADFRLIGKVRKLVSMTHAHISILDPFLVEEKAEIYHIKTARTPGWNRMHIYAAGSRTEVGFIAKRAQNSSFCRIGDSDLDLRFPEDADSSQRALLLSAALFTETLWFDD